MIVFSGLDGAGKSTQISVLVRYCIENGQNPYVIWSRGGYTKGMEKLKSFLRLLKFNNIPREPGDSKERQAYFANPNIRKIWLFLAITDLIILYGIILRLKSISGKVVICDRYILDTSIDFSLNFPKENFKKWYIWKLLNLVALKPSFYIVLTIPVKESLKRSKLKNEPFPDSEDTLFNRLNNYLEYCDNRNTVLQIDGSRNISEVSMMILNHIQK